MKLKIISDGTCPGTHVVDIETGKAIENLVGISWQLSIDKSFADVTLDLMGVSVEVVGCSQE